MGWGVRLVEAVVFGCIPVIVQDGMHQPFDEYLDYSQFSLRVRASSRRASIPSQTVPCRDSII